MPFSQLEKEKYFRIWHMITNKSWWHWLNMMTWLQINERKLQLNYRAVKCQFTLAWRIHRQYYYPLISYKNLLHANKPTAQFNVFWALKAFIFSHMSCLEIICYYGWDKIIFYSLVYFKLNKKLVFKNICLINISLFFFNIFQSYVNKERSVERLFFLFLIIIIKIKTIILYF